MGFGDLGRWIRRAIGGDDAEADGPRVHGRGRPHRFAVPAEPARGPPARTQCAARARAPRASARGPSRSCAAARASTLTSVSPRPRALAHSADDDVIRPFVPVSQASALEQLVENQLELVIAEATDRDGGTQGGAHWDTRRCDEDADECDDFFVALPGGGFERVRSTHLPSRPRL